MRSTYKQGSQSVIDVVLGSTSVEDLVSRVYYLDRISRQQAQTISEVLTTEQRLEAEKSELEDTQASQQRAVEDMQGEVDAYQAKVNEAQTYYDSLDAQVKAQLAEEAARAAETNQATNVSTAVEAIQNSQTSQGSTTSGQKENGTSAGNQQQGGTTGGQTGTTGGTTSGGTTSGGTTGGGSSSGSGASVPQGGGVSAAYAALGCPYVYAAAGPSSFNCSGLICYIYGWKYGHSASAMMNGVRASGNWKTSIDELSVGDLVFPYANGGHVGVYVGNGEYIHAANPSRGVVKDKIWSFVGGGPY
ncbi:NlpC/P60 family protein [Paratractidigestivibacter faecalis]|uniref:C40 family peptidase n=1 Tax=Paratractidigestivibacter faecalis TaxID=2292441 RepID=UPI003A9305C8